ncbi:hypothetical protein RintRC_1897 [Richelia intracellularis]|nr:hypothetical protein RintRC_1897 [Richelia intracellularis]
MEREHLAPFVSVCGVNKKLLSSHEDFETPPESSFLNYQRN